jgi:hypothetical protein
LFLFFFFFRPFAMKNCWLFIRINNYLVVF